jgi:hypothetical protein
MAHTSVMRAVELTVRCMAWREGGQWVAACIDLTLAAQASTCLEARQKLHEQIASYVNEAMTVDAEHADSLLTRKAPVKDRLRFTFWDTLSNRPRLRRTAKQVIERVGLAIKRKLAYVEPLPLRAA